ncbi:uncharacterized protein LY89DRAFT_788704 [Mollisia scopiformis]|uniref:DUF6594 domain-containing protein n=1 Tax=Mollisia scopiformis TaxID=149040 RepID=A0A132B8R9_MOLSC|nr:uncharacterized protein LY89DRAFT_788704 [Mollisia scopiformis]KUJ08802.1 hypothetical protein LY89DRAFT_788704 [Mollisia scopiformis]
MMDGYAKVAQLMASQEEFAIFRRFRALNIKRLLYLQAEIMHLEAEVSQLAKRDSTHEGRRFHTRDWWSLSQGGEGDDLEQWEKFLELSEKLDQYNDELLKQASLAKLEQPRKYDLTFLRSWFQRPGMGSFPLLGIDRGAWDTDNENDLVAIKPRAPPDMFSRWFTEDVVPHYHHIFGKTFKTPLPEHVGTGIYHYKESSLEKLISTLATVIASLLPICSVVALYIVQSNSIRLGMIAAFSACFSLALAVMTNARRIEVFAATIFLRFAAVNVVFLTNGPSYPM